MDFLGFAKDKSPSFHVNLGQQQLHLAENGDPAQVVTGSIGLTVPNLSTIRERIANIRHTGSLFEGTQYAVLASEDSPMDDGVTAVSVASVPTQLPKHIAEGSRLVDMLSSARAHVGRLDVIVMDIRDKEREATKNARAARKDSKRSRFLKEREHIKTELTAAEGELQAAQAEYKETLRVLEEWRKENYPSSDEEEDDEDGADGDIGGETMSTDRSKSQQAGGHGKDWPDQHVTTLYRYNKAQLAAHTVQGQVDAYRSYELNCPKSPKAAEAEVMESGNCVVEVV